MKKVGFLILLPFFLFSQETNLIGDVNCDGDISSDDASLILQYVTGVVDSLPCLSNISGLTVDQLDDMIEMMSGQLVINYGGMSFGDWVLKYDAPSFDSLIYDQEDTDGFLLIQYSRASQSNSSSSFAFNIYTGSVLDTVNFIMDVVINIKNSWNPIDSKTIPIKKGDYWLLEDDSGTSIDKIYFLPINGDANISENNSNSLNPTIVNKNMMFPDGYGGDPLSWNLEDSAYVVPNGKNLYITQYHNTEQSDGIFIQPDYSTLDAIQINKGHNNYIVYTGIAFSPSNTNGMPIVVGETETVSGQGSFNGFLIDAIVDPITFDLSDETDFDDIVPDDQILYILQFYGDDSAELIVDDVTIFENYSNNIFYTGVGYTPAMTLSVPILVGPGQSIAGSGHVNGYFVNLNYFSQ